jgi:hypothetical protein
MTLFRHKNRKNHHDNQVSVTSCAVIMQRRMGVAIVENHAVMRFSGFSTHLEYLPGFEQTKLCPLPSWRATCMGVRLRGFGLSSVDNVKMIVVATDVESLWIDHRVA